LRAGQEITIRNWDGCTALYIAVSNMHTRIGELLLSCVGNTPYISIRNDEGDTALHAAATNADITMMKILTSSEIDVALRSYEDGAQAILCAAVDGSAETIQTLLEIGCDLHSKSTSGFTMMHIAAAFNHSSETILYLKNMGLDIGEPAVRGCTPIRVASMNGNLDAVKWLKEAGGDNGAIDNLSVRPIHHAVANGHNSVQYLTGAGEDVSVGSEDTGFTPLHFAARAGKNQTLYRGPTLRTSRTLRRKRESQLTKYLHHINVASEGC
jgi:ankyrin repeat protein